MDRPGLSPSLCMLASLAALLLWHSGPAQWLSIIKYQIYHIVWLCNQIKRG